MATDPWQPVGTVLFHIVQFVANATGYTPLTGGGSMPRDHSEEPEPRWMLCVSCGHSTWHTSYFWVVDKAWDWECDVCGAVTYG